MNTLKYEIGIFDWCFQPNLISRKKWLKKFLYNFIFFIINHDISIITFWMPCTLFIIIWGHSEITFAQISDFWPPSPLLVSVRSTGTLFNVRSLKWVIPSPPSPPPQKSSATFMNFWMDNWGVKRENNYAFCKLNIKDQCFFHSYIYNDNKIFTS